MDECVKNDTRFLFKDIERGGHGRKERDPSFTLYVELHSVPGKRPGAEEAEGNQL